MRMNYAGEASYYGRSERKRERKRDLERDREEEREREKRGNEMKWNETIFIRSNRIVLLLDLTSRSQYLSFTVL